MGLRASLRRHPVLVSLGGGLLLLVLLALAVGWYALGEERRTGRLLARVLSRQVGIPVRVERARAEPARLTLRGVSIPPGAHWGGAVEIRELRVEGGVLPVVFPRGRAVSVVAVSTSVTLAKEPAPLAAPAADTLSAIRRAALRLLEWPAAASLEMKGGEIRSEGATVAFDLRGEKSTDGKLVLRLFLRGPQDQPALTVEALGAAAGQDVRLAVRVEGDPRPLGPFWPAALPAPARLAGEATLALAEPPELGVSGRLTATPAGGANPAPLVARFDARYRPRERRADLARLELQWGAGVELALAGSAEELDGSPRLTVKMSGSVDGSRLGGDATYVSESGRFRARLDLQPFAARPLLERLGYPRPALEVSARRAELVLEGRGEGKDRGRVEGVLGLEGVETPLWRAGTRLGAALRFDGAVERGRRGLSVARLERGELSLASPTGGIGLVTGRTQARSAGAAGLWPLAVEARIPDLSRLPALDALPLTLSGDARVGGTLDWPDAGPRFDGQLTAHVTRAELTLGTPLVISELRTSLPLAWGDGAEAPAGRVTAESLTAFGFALRGLASPARQSGSTLSLPEITYRHYGGSGKGSARLELGGAAVPLSMRLDGEGVDLATLTREYGLTIGRITGTVRYLLVLQHSQASGLIAGGHVASDPPGGEVNIDAVKKLLAYAEADPSGILRRTLESLSVFSYESLTGDIRVGREGGRVSLSLQGKKRFGLFPGPVRAINFQNVPLSLLVKTFGQPRRELP